MPRIEEGVELRDVTLEVIDYLQDVYDKLEAGLEHHIIGDPFYQRANGQPPFSDEQVDRVIAAIDEEFAAEIGQYPGYHRNRSGANSTPDFWRLNPTARRSVVEGLDAIYQRHAALAAQQAAEQAAQEAAQQAA
jgi:hypothetical protein